jgi:hypothetical protein
MIGPELPLTQKFLAQILGVRLTPALRGWRPRHGSGNKATLPADHPRFQMLFSRRDVLAMRVIADAMCRRPRIGAFSTAFFAGTRQPSAATKRILRKSQLPDWVARLEHLPKEELS